MAKASVRNIMIQFIAEITTKQIYVSCGSTKFAVCLYRKDIKQRKEKGVNIRKVRAKGQE